MLFDISAHDPVTVAGVASLLTFVVFAACYIPARRVTRVNPMVALRNDRRKDWRGKSNATRLNTKRHRESQ